MPAFLYHCPTTGLHVQGWTDVEESDWTDEGYEAVTCVACSAVHLINQKTGKGVSEQDE